MAERGVAQVIRVVIADDQELVRAGLLAMLSAEDDLEVVAEVADGADAISAARVHDADVVLMDIRMPVMDGIEATRHLVASRVRARIVMMTTFDLDEYVYEGVKAGASAFLLKDMSGHRLAEAVRVVAHGEALVEPIMTRHLIEVFTRRPMGTQADPTPLAALSQRETEVLGLVAAGMSNTEIAARLFLSEATVKSLIANVLDELDVHDRIQAVVVAYEAGLAQPGGR
jgi:DNA-binding NarL/FixJ family response regulator